MRIPSICAILAAATILSFPVPGRAESYDHLKGRSMQYLVYCQSVLMQQYKLGSYQHFHWSQPDGQLIFSDHGVVKVIATVQFVGDVSKKSNTWLWAWANNSFLDRLKAASLRVRAYGVQHAYSQLTQAEWSADQEDGWDMTAIAATLLKARGAYRTEDGNGFVYMIITDIRWANTPKAAR
jgi:hypothetical protein